MGRFEEKLSSVEAESAKVSDEIEGQIRNYEEGEGTVLVWHIMIYNGI